MPQPLKVYYLDDEPALLEVFEESYACDWLIIKTFSDPAEAIKFIKANPPDILFLDYRLPNTTGDAVAQQLPGGFPKVLITGDLHVQPVTQFAQIIYKPYSPEAVPAVIRMLFPDRKTA